MVLPIIVAIVVIFVLIIFLLRLEHHFRKYKMTVLSLIILLLIISIVYVFGTNEIDYGSYKGIYKGVLLYFFWIFDLAKSVWGSGVEITGKVIGAIGFGK